MLGSEVKEAKVASIIEPFVTCFAAIELLIIRANHPGKSLYYILNKEGVYDNNPNRRQLRHKLIETSIAEIFIKNHLIKESQLGANAHLVFNR